MSKRVTASLVKGVSLLWLAVFALASLVEGCGLDRREFPEQEGDPRESPMGEEDGVIVEAAPLLGVCVPDVPCLVSNPCHQGVVVCSPSGLASCRDTLLLQADGSVCGDGATCRDGNCEQRCAIGRTACAGSCCAPGQGCCSNACVNLNGSANCGACGNVCDGCTNGRCPALWDATTSVWDRAVWN